MRFEWDKNKAKTNLKKHRVSFEEAETVFEDDFTVTISDDEHSFEEKRFVTIGQSLTGRLLIISHTFDEEKIRIINARKPTKAERKDYENR
jgi:uncharacterized DUF497 family protein